MERIENDCVGCGDYCRDCGAKRTKHYYCDRCEFEEQLWEFEGRQLCIECIKSLLKKV